ncbi:MAG: AI-2E family transporter [Cyclobacteriaceae bacterium]|nr:AI-2E family transporter [Cyclobacteriaceae bacterium]
MNRFFGFIFLGIAIFLLLGWVFSDVFFYIIVSSIIAAILRPINKYFLRNRFFGVKVPKGASAALSFVVLGLLILVFSLIFTPLITKQIQVISSIDYSSLFDKLAVPVAKLEKVLINYNLSSRKEGFISEEIKNTTIEFVKEIKFSKIFNSILTYTGNIFVGFLAISFITFFFLVDFDLFRRKIISIIPNKYFEVSISALTKIEHLLSNYLVALIIQMLVVFSMVAIGLTLVNVPYAMTIALFAAVANLIPYLGPLLGASFAIIITIVQTGVVIDSINSLLVLLLKIGAVFAVVQITDNVITQPLIFSKSIKAHPLEIFVIIFAAATLAGVVGMILAIPVYTILRVSVNELSSGYKQYRIFKT